MKESKRLWGLDNEEVAIILRQGMLQMERKKESWAWDMVSEEI